MINFNKIDILFIVVVSLVILLYLIIYFNNNTQFNIEGLENQNPNTQYEDYSKQEETSYMLAQKNSANIMFLKQEYDEIQKLKQKIQELSTNVDQNTQGLTAILEQQQKYAQSVQNASSEEMQ